MAHLTLSIPDPVYSEMKKHPEIKWSAVAREAIIEKTTLLKKSMHTKDFLRLLSPETQKEIKAVLKSKDNDFKKIQEVVPELKLRE